MNQALLDSLQDAILHCASDELLFEYDARKVATQHHIPGPVDQHIWAIGCSVICWIAYRRKPNPRELIATYRRCTEVQMPVGFLHFHFNAWIDPDEKVQPGFH